MKNYIGHSSGKKVIIFITAITILLIIIISLIFFITFQRMGTIRKNRDLSLIVGLAVLPSHYGGIVQPPVYQTHPKPATRRQTRKKPYPWTKDDRKAKKPFVDMQMRRHCLRPTLSDIPPQKNAPTIIPKYTTLPGRKRERPYFYFLLKYSRLPHISILCMCTAVYDCVGLLCNFFSY